MSVFDKIFDFNFENDTGLFNLTSGFFVGYVNKLFSTKNRAILIVCPSIYEARKIYNKFIDTRDVIIFENDDLYFSNDSIVSPELMVDRLNILNDLLVDSKKIVITDVSGYLKILPNVNNFNDYVIKISRDNVFSLNDLVSKLVDIGYSRETMVSKMGEFALRGFVLDIFPINNDNPIRISFFGDDVEAIKTFDLDSQRSINEIDSFTLLPNKEIISDNISSIFDYLNNPIVIYKDYEQIKFTYEKMIQDVFYYGNDKKYFLDINDVKVSDKLFYFDIDNLSLIDIKKSYDFGVSQVPLFNENFLDINNFVNKSVLKKKTVIIFVSISNVNYFLDKLDFPFVITDINNIYDNKVNIIKGKFSEGFETRDYVILTDYELFNKKNVATKRTRFKNSSRIKDLSKISVGDYVVHELYGIGIYNGLKVLTKNGVASDYLEILYAKGDKLYIPASKIELIGKYTGKDGYKPNINSLNSSAWQKTKMRIREKIKYESERLIRVQAERQLRRGFAFSPDQPLQVMFESEFNYEETADQIKAINEIKQDMESKVPMDRILCGDVGYGKTEVAFRAMFKAVLDNKQVLYLCPTTLLCKQQYEVALDRFKNYPVNIGILNRFVSLKDTKKTLNDLKDGKIDILFGTHRILSDDVICKDLGLLVVDEEQRFGVAHKEKIKELKANVDVLTLTATPIPRTLQMAILGIKNLSLIETPPKNRKSVVTYVTPYEEKLIRDVVYKEVSRGGQVFILYNSIADIEIKVNSFRKILPDISINYAHGQMDKNNFENVMNDFIDGKFDVLVCTTIIETGVDIPNANTLIVIDADKFGLSQLYQIRGRVGRSDNLAYAYLMYDPKKVLTETAVKRLNAIKDFTYLGSGLAIATRDLAIRGAGDILGSEQAGFIDSVGIDLYLKMLNEEIAKLKGEDVKDDLEENDLLKVNVPSHIKDNYVSDDEVKLQIHKLVNSINSFDDLNKVELEIEDRFGKIDNDLKIYMNEQLFESFVKKLGVIKVFDNNIYREVIFDREFSSKLDYEDLFIKSLDINKNFKFLYKNNMLSVILYYNKSNNHVVFDFNKFFNEL